MTSQAVKNLLLLIRHDALCDRRHGWVKGANGVCVRSRRQIRRSQRGTAIVPDRSRRGRTAAIAVGATVAGVTAAGLASYLLATKLSKSDFIQSGILNAQQKVIDNIDEFNHFKMAKRLEGVPLPNVVKDGLIGLTGKTKAWASSLFIQKELKGEFVFADKKTNTATYKTEKGSLYSVGSVKDNVVALYTEHDKKDSDLLGHPVFSVGFMVNDEFSQSDISKEDGLKVLTMVSSIFDSQLAHLPEKCYIQCVASDGDAKNKSKKNTIYKRKGFFDAGGGSLWAAVEGGKVRKLTQQEKDAFVVDLMIKTPYNLSKTDSLFYSGRIKDLCLLIRHDATSRGGVRCGKAYISKSKKCKIGEGGFNNDRPRSIPSSLNQSEGFVAEDQTEISALKVAQRKGFLKKIAVDKNDFDWPGNGKTSPDIEKRYNTFKRGDLIENAFYMNGSYVRHYGVYGGKDKKTGQHTVYQVGLKSDRSGQIIKKEPLTTKKPIEFSAWRQTPMEERSSTSLNRNDIIRRAEATVGKDFHYNLVRSNCEHYARAVTEGKAYSRQTDDASPLVTLVGDLISIGVRRSATWKNGMTAKDISEMLEGINKVHGRSSATNKSLYIKGRTDAIDDRVSFGDLKSPQEFEASVKQATASMPGTGGDLLREEMYTNYLVLIHKMLARGR